MPNKGLMRIWALCVYQRKDRYQDVCWKKKVLKQIVSVKVAEKWLKWDKSGDVGWRLEIVNWLIK
jgi:hypothetical protein